VSNLIRTGPPEEEFRKRVGPDYKSMGLGWRHLPGGNTECVTKGGRSSWIRPRSGITLPKLGRCRSGRKEGFTEEGVILGRRVRLVGEERHKKEEAKGEAVKRKGVM